MYSQTHSPFLLRKISGRFDAVRRVAGTSVRVPGASSPGGHSVLSALGGFFGAAVLFVLAMLVLAYVSGSGEVLLATAPVAVSHEQIKAVRDDLMKAFETFKASNDERLAAIEKRGSADPILNESVDKANAEITKISAKLNELEKVAARPQIEAARTKEDLAIRARVAEFHAAARGVDPEEIEVTAEMMSESGAYAKAMRAWMKKGSVNAAMSVGSNPDGGYLVSPDKSGRIVELVYESSPMRALATIETTTSDTYAGGTDLGEAGSGWVGETQDRTETGTPQVGEWSIPVHELYAEPQTTQKVLDDSMRDPEGWLARKVAAKFARDEATAFVTGNGIKKPRGILSYANASAPTAANWQRIKYLVTGVSGDFAASNKADIFIDMIHTLKGAYRPGAVFFAATATIAAIRKLKDTTGQYLFQPDVVNGFLGRVHGYPLAEFPDMPAIAANSISVGFGNLREGYTIVDRLGIRVLRDPLTKKGWVKFYTTKRVGGDVTNFEAITLLKFGTS